MEESKGQTMTLCKELCSCYSHPSSRQSSEAAAFSPLASLLYNPHALCPTGPPLNIDVSYAVRTTPRALRCIGDVSRLGCEAYKVRHCGVPAPPNIHPHAQAPPHPARSPSTMPDRVALSEAPHAAALHQLPMLPLPSSEAPRAASLHQPIRSFPCCCPPLRA